MFSQTRTAAAAGVCYAGGEEIMRRRSEKDAVLPLRGEMFAWSGSEEGKGKGGCTAWAELLIREAGRRMPINPTHLRQRTLSSYLAHISSLSFAFPAWLFCTFIHLRSSYPTGRVSPLPSLPTQYTSLIQTIRREHPPFFSHPPSPPLPLLAFVGVFLSLIVPDLHSLVFRYPTSLGVSVRSRIAQRISILEGSVRT